MNVFKIVWRQGAYHVSIPNYEGGDVVPYEDARDLQNELEAERAKVAKLTDALAVFANYFDGDLSEIGGGTHVAPVFKLRVFKDAKQALNETKPNEPKRIN